MRKGFTRFAMLLMLLGLGNGLWAASGGPDAYGYIWKDSNEPGGPAFTWNSIVGHPDAVQVSGLLDDNSVGQFNMSWSFHYYWSDYNKFKLGSNGWISFNNVGNIAHCFPAVPTQGGAGDNLLAPFMTDLNFTGSGNPGQVWYWDNGSDTLIVEWSNTPWWTQAAPSYAGSNSFQIILSGVDSSITFMYEDMDPAAFNNTTGCAFDLEIGIENITGNIGLEVLNETVPADNYAVKFYYPATVTFQVPDATPNWVGNPDNAGQFVLANGSSQTVMANVKNVGNANITNNISLAATITPGGILNTSTSIATGLAAGDDSTVTFPGTAIFSNPGSYIYTVTSTNSQDINPSNNSTAVELVAVACSNDTMNLRYYSGTTPDGVIAWGGGSGNEGAGIYITPPSYPATIDAVDLFIADIDQDPLAVDPYSIVIYDANGLPGAVLDSVFVPANQIVENTWARIQMNSTAVINSGGFYVGWIQAAGNVALGTESLAPISRRSFEVIGGGWSPYRNSTVEDFMLSAHVTTVCLVGNNNPANVDFSLKALPNPSNGNTSFEFTLPVMGDASIRLVDLQGKEVFRSDLSGATAGHHSVNFNASSVPSGLYFVQLEQGSARVATKFVVTR